MSLSRTLLGFAVLTLTAGCGGEPAEQPAAESASAQVLTVSGPIEAVDTFVRDQQARDPAVGVSTTVGSSAGVAQARLEYPASYGAAEIGEITRAALAAGLSYELKPTAG